MTSLLSSDRFHFGVKNIDGISGGLDVFLKDCILDKSISIENPMNPNG